MLAELQTEKKENADREAATEQLREENKEYRKSVAELHAIANELEELKLERSREQESSRQRLQEATMANAELTAELAELRGKVEVTPEDHDEAARALDEAKRLATALGESEEKLIDRDERLQQLAQELSKSRSELASVRSELSEQRAVARSLSKQQTGKSVPETAHGENGQTKKGSRTKKGRKVSRVVKTETTTTDAGKDASTDVVTKPDERLGPIFTTAPAHTDDLKRITGVGPVLEKRLNDAGIYQFDQIKRWTKSNIDNLDQHLSLGGRIKRDNWVAQARRLTTKE